MQGKYSDRESNRMIGGYFGLSNQRTFGRRWHLSWCLRRCLGHEYSGREGQGARVSDGCDLGVFRQREGSVTGGWWVSWQGKTNHTPLVSGTEHWALIFLLLWYKATWGLSQRNWRVLTFVFKSSLRWLGYCGRQSRAIAMSGKTMVAWTRVMKVEVKRCVNKSRTHLELITEKTCWPVRFLRMRQSDFWFFWLDQWVILFVLMRDPNYPPRSWFTRHLGKIVRA